jgi:SCY1-like protein 1
LHQMDGFFAKALAAGSDALTKAKDAAREVDVVALRAKAVEAGRKAQEVAQQASAGIADLVSALPYSIGEEVQSQSELFKWTLLKGKRKDNGKAVSIFKLNKVGLAKGTLDMAENSLRNFKTLRHPDVLAYQDAEITDKHIILVVEAVRPLTDLLAEYRTSEGSCDAELMRGLSAVCRALDFIAARAGKAHGFVCPVAVFVTEAGDWKLGALDLASKVGADGPDEFFKQ